jgi:hypothetical protein
MGVARFREAWRAERGRAAPGRRRRVRAAAGAKRPWSRSREGGMQSASDTPSSHASQGRAQPDRAPRAHGVARPGAGRTGATTGRRQGARPSGRRSPRTDSRATRDSPDYGHDADRVAIMDSRSSVQQRRSGVRWTSAWLVHPTGWSYGEGRPSGRDAETSEVVECSVACAI